MATYENLESLLKTKLQAKAKLPTAIEETKKKLLLAQKEVANLGPKAASDKKLKDAYTKATKAVEELKIMLGNLLKSAEAAQKIIESLDIRLKALKIFVESRNNHLKWWDKEELAALQLTDKARDEANLCESEARQALEAAKAGQSGPAVSKPAMSAMVRANVLTRNVEVIKQKYQGWLPTWDKQRNLKTSELLKEDIDSYAELTRKVYATFLTGESAMKAVIRHSEAAGKSAAAASEALKSSGSTEKVTKSLESMLQEGIREMGEVVTEIKAFGTGKWAKVIINDGAMLTTFKKAYVEKPGDLTRIPALKAAEQADAFMRAEMTRVENLCTSLKKKFDQLTQRLGSQAKDRQFQDPINKMRMLQMAALTLKNGYEKHYELAQAALKELNNALSVKPPEPKTK